jgi:hypothetical protein
MNLAMNIGRVCLLAAFVSPVLFATNAGAQGARPARVRLDHVPIAVRDLDSAVADYRALGFSFKPGTLHANSIRNAHIKFRDGTALELITASRAGDRVAANYLRILKSGEGAAHLSLDGGQLDRLAANIRSLNVPFDTVRGPYFGWLAFTDTSPLDYLFFGVITSRPLDLPEHLRHRNSATRLAAVWLAKENYPAEEALFRALGYRAAPANVGLPGSATVQEVRLDRGSIYLHQPASRFRAVGPVVGVTIEVEDLARTQAILPAGTERLVVSGSDSRGKFLRLPPSATHGLWLEFMEPRE